MVRTMRTVAQRAIRSLVDAGVHVLSGMSEDQLASAETRYSVRFCSDHRELLQLGLPVGSGWYDWREPESGAIADALAWPREGILFDVLHNAFWPASWGIRPPGRQASLESANRRIDDLPPLVPLYGHRFMPSHPVASPAPVFSVHQSDVITYGADLADYVAAEFGDDADAPYHPSTVRVPFWSDLADAVTPDAL